MRAIVVGIDSTHAAERALDRALAEGQRTGRHVRALHAWRRPLALDGRSRAEELRHTQDLVAKGCARLGAESVDVTAEVVEGYAGPVLAAASADAALLVVGGQNYRALVHALLGSTTAYALNHSECPVMVVPEQGGPVSPSHRVVVGVDGSDASRSALLWGREVAEQQGCPLVAVHAWLLETLPNDPILYRGAEVVTFEKSALAWLEHEVREVLGDAEVECRAVHGAACYVMVDAAGPDDLLVLGSRGAARFVDRYLGSVPMHCARHARGVLAVIPAGQEHV
jgi:nucleotide-binding universal stress UspA family protein